MKKVIILFGGKSAEHEVSIMSAKNIYAAIDTALFEVDLMYQTKSGHFLQVESFENLQGKIASLEDFKVDCVFPVMHGPNCEDGSIQGFLQTLGVSYVGPKVLSSALCMDKDFQKQVAQHNGIRVTDWIAVKNFEYVKNKEEKLAEIKNIIHAKLHYPVFVKPCNMGSSVGVTKVKNDSELEQAIESAFRYDTKISIEKMVVGREVEVAVCGKDSELLISNPGEVVSKGNHEFYDYNAKYLDSSGSETFIPAKNIHTEKIQELKEISRKVYTLFECSGLSRIDFFLQEDGGIILNEINTLPGFTSISMYPKLMEEVGVGYTELITRLIEGSIK